MRITLSTLCVFQKHGKLNKRSRNMTGKTSRGFTELTYIIQNWKYFKIRENHLSLEKKWDTGELYITGKWFQKQTKIEKVWHFNSLRSNVLLTPRGSVSLGRPWEERLPTERPGKKKEREGERQHSHREMVRSRNRESKEDRTTGSTEWVKPDCLWRIICYLY